MFNEWSIVVKHSAERIKMVNGGITKIVIGGALSGGLAILSFMGYGIVNNDIRNTSEHIEIRKEQAVGDEKVSRKIDSVKDIVTDIQLEQRELTVLINRIDKKL